MNNDLRKVGDGFGGCIILLWSFMWYHSESELNCLMNDVFRIDWLQSDRILPYGSFSVGIWFKHQNEGSEALKRFFITCPLYVALWGWVAVILWHHSKTFSCIVCFSSDTLMYILTLRLISSQTSTPNMIYVCYLSQQYLRGYCPFAFGSWAHCLESNLIYV